MGNKKDRLRNKPLQRDDEKTLRKRRQSPILEKREFCREIDEAISLLLSLYSFFSPTRSSLTEVFYDLYSTREEEERGEA